MPLRAIPGRPDEMQSRNIMGASIGDRGPAWDPTTWEELRAAMRRTVEATAQCRRVLPVITTGSDMTNVALDQIGHTGHGCR